MPRPARLSAVCLAAVALALAAAGCGGGSRHAATGHVNARVDGTAVYGALPPTGHALHGGTISFGLLTAEETPTEIFPMADGANTGPSDFELTGALYLPLYNGPSGAVPSVDYAMSVGRRPSFSDGDRTVTIPLRQGLHWSDGAPVDADDVLFFIALLKAAVAENASNWGQYTPGEFPSSVTSMSAPNGHTVVLHLDRPWNPGFFLDNQLQDTDGGVYPIPSTAWNIDRAGGPHLTDWRTPAVARRIYNYLSRAGTTIATFASDPLWRDVDGPFTLQRFSVTNGSYDLVANPRYGLSPRPAFANLSVESFTSESSALDALEGGSVDVIPLDPSQLGDVSSLRSGGVRVFGAPSFGWFAGIINFRDRTDDFDRVVAQLYVRQALEHLVDEPGLIKGVYKNAAAPAYGPVPADPVSPYAPADATTPPYPYSPPTAAALLRAHGWKVVPGGQTTCARSGTGSGECGAGIPRHTPLRFTWATEPAAVSAASVLDAEAIASIARRAAGIDITVQVKSVNFLETGYNDSGPQGNPYVDDWGVVTTPDGDLLDDYYPTQDGYDSSGPGYVNTGGYDDPTTNRLIRASIHSGAPRAVAREASYITRDLPDLFLPNPDVLYAVAKGIGGPADAWLSLSEGSAFFPEYWYRTGG